MNILITLNDTYSMPCFALIESLLEHHRDISINIMFQNLSEENRTKFKALETKNRKKAGSIQVHLIQAETQLFSSAHVSIHITHEAYLRLLAQHFLPDCLDRCLYLDPDIIVLRNLEDFYYSSFDECYYIVCEGPGVSQKNFAVYDTLAIPHNEKYFNSGVMLMNLTALRRDVPKKLIMDYVDSMGSQLQYHDQDVLNGLFWNKVKYVEWHVYNQTILHIQNKREAKERLKTAAIIHYAGSDKPWKYNYCSWYFGLFWKYARRAGYSTLYANTLFNRTKWHLNNKIKAFFPI